MNNELYGYAHQRKKSNSVDKLIGHVKRTRWGISYMSGERWWRL